MDLWMTLFNSLLTYTVVHRKCGFENRILRLKPILNNEHTNICSVSSYEDVMKLNAVVREVFVNR